MTKKIRSMVAAGLASLVESGCTVELVRQFNKYQITVWPERGGHTHHHYIGETLDEAIFKSLRVELKQKWEGAAARLIGKQDGDKHE